MLPPGNIAFMVFVAFIISGAWVKVLGNAGTPVTIHLEAPLEISFNDDPLAS